MAWLVRFEGDTVVDLDDLSPSVFDDIAKDDRDGTWWTVYAFPGGHPERLYRVICACAELAGVDPPDRPATMTDAKNMLALLEQKTDIEDLPMQDGFPSTPDVPESGSTSGAPGDSDGPPTLLNDSPSEDS